MRMMKSLCVALVMALSIGVGVLGCTVLKTTAQAAYTAGSQAVGDYCAMPLATRAVAQLVLVGKVYNSGVCDVVNGDVDLQAQLATATAAQINALLAAKVNAALAEGTIDQATADLILSGSTAQSTAAADAVAVTTAATTKPETAAAIITDTEVPAAATADPVKAG